MTNKEFIEQVERYLYNGNFIDYDGTCAILNLFKKYSIPYTSRIIGSPVYETHLYSYIIEDKPEILVLRYKQF